MPTAAELPVRSHLRWLVLAAVLGSGRGAFGELPPVVIDDSRSAPIIAVESGFVARSAFGERLLGGRAAAFLGAERAHLRYGALIGAEAGRTEWGLDYWVLRIAPELAARLGRVQVGAGLSLGVMIIEPVVSSMHISVGTFGLHVFATVDLVPRLGPGALYLGLEAGSESSYAVCVYAGYRLGRPVVTP